MHKQGRNKGEVSLERALSKLGILSRSKAREAIIAGEIKVNGKTITNPNLPVVPEVVRILWNQEVKTKARPVTLLLYKPKGYVTTASDEKGRPTVFDLLPASLPHLGPVGRLDMQTSGLLILTNQTQLANYLTSPENKVARVYLVTVKGLFADSSRFQLLNGVLDEGEILKAESLVIRKSSQRESHLTITLQEGKNREIRRMLDLVEHPVTSLKRVQFGLLDLGGLKPGEHRLLTEDEIKSLLLA